MASISATTQHHSGPLNRGLTLAPSPRTNPVAGHSSYPAKLSLAWSRSSRTLAPESRPLFDGRASRAMSLVCLHSFVRRYAGGKKQHPLLYLEPPCSHSIGGHWHMSWPHSISAVRRAAERSHTRPNADMVTDVHMPSRCRKARHCTRHNPITETATGIHPSITSTHHGYPNNLCAKEREINS